MGKTTSSKSYLAFAEVIVRFIVISLSGYRCEIDVMWCDVFRHKAASWSGVRLLWPGNRDGEQLDMSWSDLLVRSRWASWV